MQLWQRTGVLYKQQSLSDRGMARQPSQIHSFDPRERTTWYLAKRKRLLNDYDQGPSGVYLGGAITHLPLCIRK